MVCRALSDGEFVTDADFFTDFDTVTAMVDTPCFDGFFGEGAGAVKAGSPEPFVKADFLWGGFRR